MFNFTARVLSFVSGKSYELAALAFAFLALAVGAMMLGQTVVAVVLWVLAIDFGASSVLMRKTRSFILRASPSRGQYDQYESA